MSKIITKKQLNLVIENTMKEFKYNITRDPNNTNQLPEPPKELHISERSEMCPECGGMIKEGLCESGCGSMSEGDYMDEELHGDQKKLDKNKNNKIDSEDFVILRGEKDEVEESVEELTESLLKTTNTNILKEEMDFFNKMINYKNN